MLIIHLSAQAQCPLRDTLWNRISFLADHHITPDLQLQELLDYRVKLASCTSARDSTDAYLLQRIGVMYYLKSDYPASVKYTLGSLDILHDLQKGIRINPRQKFKCFWNLNIYYDSLNQLDKKKEVNDSCISIGLGANLNDSLILYSIWFKIVDLLNIGDYLRCIQYATLSQNLAEKYAFNHTDIVKRILAFKLNALLLIEDYPSVATELKNKIQEYEHDRNYDYIGNLYGIWASYYLGTGKIDSALISHKRAFRFNLKMGLIAGCAESLNGIGFVYFKYLNDYPKALNYYFRSLSYYDTKEAISTLTNIGNLYVKEQLFDSAFYYYQKAFDQIHSGFNESSLFGSWNKDSLNSLAEYVVTLVLDKADAYLFQVKATGKENQLKQALVSYRTADQFMDKIKQNQFEMQSKLFWRKSIRRLYEHAIEASRLDKNPEEGFYFFEKSRAVLLNDQLKEDRLMQNREILEQYQLRIEINHLEKELDTANPHADHYPKIQAGIIGKKENLDRLQQALNAKDPLFFARNPDAETMKIQDLQKNILDDHSSLLEIFNGDSSIFTLFITRSGSSISKINKQEFDSLSQQFMSYISNPVFLNNNFQTFTDRSRKLYKLIFSGHTLPTGRLIISPDGICFPFEGLITIQDPDIHYMLNDYSISYTYSARFLMSHFTNGTDKGVADFMGMAPVVYAPYLNLTPLPGSETSLNRIRSHFRNPYTAVDSAASKTNFLTNFTHYQVVQIYSHASYRGSGGKPVIYFADSSMDLSELFSKERPAARLVVLSACETALGKDYKGEGVFSFSREFAALGIPASVSNLWSVDNESTYRITELFYQYISDGLSTDIALQQAKLKYIHETSREKRMPFYWASSILTGKTEIIKTKTSFQFQYVVLVIGIVGIFFWILLNMYKSRI